MSNVKLLSPSEVSEPGSYWMRLKGTGNWFIHRIENISGKDMWTEQLEGFELVKINPPDVPVTVTEG